MSRPWFKKPKDGLLKQARKLNDGKQSWATEQLIKDEKEILPVASVYQCRKLDLRIQIARELGATVDDATLAVQLAETSLVAWQSNREDSKRGQAGKIFQQSMTTFAYFLENFSGIIEIVRDADDQYGGLAYGTLSIFLGVFVRKTQREEKLLEGFEELGYAFPRLRTLKALGSTQREQTAAESDSREQLERLMMETFTLVIEFAREATQYYISSARRAKETLLPERIKAGTFLQIQAHLGKVREQCDILLLAQISSLQDTIEGMRHQLEETHAEVMQTADKAYAAKARKLLGVEARSDHTGDHALRSLESLLQHSFSKLHASTEHQRPTSMELLHADEGFDRWWTNPTSCLFIGGGVNWREESPTGLLNWLSLGALLVVKELEQAQKNVAYYLVQTTLWASQSHQRSLRDVMASVIFQLALTNKDVFELDRLESFVNCPEWSGADPEAFMEAVHDLLLDTMSKLNANRQIWIVIDRLDKCRWTSDDNGVGLHFAVERLLNLMSKLSCCIKVLVVVDAPSGRRIANFGMPLTESKRDRLILKSQWRQEAEIGRSQSF